MSKPIKPLLILVPILFLFGCASNPINRIAEKWPEITPETQQAKSLAASAEALTILQEPDALIQLSQKDISEYLVPALRTKLVELEIDNTKRLEVPRIELDFDPQAIRIDADFDLHLVEPDFIIKGRIKGMVAVAVQDSAVSFYPVVDTIQLDEVDRSKIKIRWDDLKKPEELWVKLKSRYYNILAAKVANAAFENLMSAINRVAFKNPIDWNLDVNFVSEKPFNKMVKAGKSEKVTYTATGSDKQIRPDLFVGEGAIFISDNGLSIMADINDTPVGVEKGMDRLLAAEADPSAFDANYQIFKQKFKSVWAKHFDQTNNNSQILIRKKVIADTLNSALDSIQEDGPEVPFLIVTAKHKPMSLSFAQRFKLYRKDAVNCESKRKSCSKKISCGSTVNCDARGKNCASPRSCEENCQKWDLVCMAKAEWCLGNARAEADACRQSQNVEVKNCKLAEKTKEYICGLNEDAKAEACRIGQNLEVTNCKTKLEALRVVDGFLDLGEVEVDVAVSGINGVSSVFDLTANEDLTEITLESHTDASAAANIGVHVNPDGIEHLACFWKMNPNISVVASTSQKLNVKGRITRKEVNPNGETRMVSTDDLNGLAQPEQGEKFFLVMSARSDPIMLELNPDPWDTLTSDPRFMLNCSLLGMAMQTAEVVDLLKPGKFPVEVYNAMMGKYEYEGISFEVEQEVLPLKMTIAGDRILFKPRWGDKTIGFVR
jgi:hypothetical protein